MNCKDLNRVFQNLKIRAKAISYKQEGCFFIFDIKLLADGKYRTIENHTTEIALSLKALAQPITYPVISEGVIRMEVMIKPQETVRWEDVVVEIREKKLPLVLGKTRTGEAFIKELVELPHLLIGGSTGSGKSIMLHSIINGLAYSSNVKFALIDTKRVEFSIYDDWNKLYLPVAKSGEEATDLLVLLVKEMERRFRELEKRGKRSISNMPYLVLVVDEFADLMMTSKRTVQDLLCRLAQKSRAAGIHLIVATQRPSADVITGLIKANFQARIACKVSSPINSRILLDRNGAERLTGKGDAIFQFNDIMRFKGCFIDAESIKARVDKNRKKHSIWRKIWAGTTLPMMFGNTEMRLIQK